MIVFFLRHTLRRHLGNINRLVQLVAPTQRIEFLNAFDKTHDCFLTLKDILYQFSLNNSFSYIIVCPEYLIILKTI